MLACAFCLEPNNLTEGRRLVAGPGVYICTICSVKFWAELKDKLTFKDKAKGTDLETCAFCIKPVAADFRKTANSTTICVECLELCQEVFQEEGFVEGSPMDKAARYREPPIRATVSGIIDGKYQVQVPCVLMKSKEALKVGDEVKVKLVKAEDGTVFFEPY